MPFARDTLTDLVAQAVQDIESAGLTDFKGNVLTQHLLANSVLRTLAKVVAGQANEEYGYIDYISLQANPFTATGEWALAWGALKGVYQLAATPTQMTVQFTATTGTNVPIGTALSRSSDGFGYLSTASVTASGGLVTVPCTATLAGAAGNCVTGAAVGLANGIAGVNASGTVVTTVFSGQDQETEAAFKTRYLARYAAPPQGGATADYVEWATSVNGVTRAWASTVSVGPGTVVVYFMMDFGRASFQGFPQGTTGVATLESRDSAATGDQLVVANYVFPLRPVTALVYLAAPTPFPINMTIIDLGAANTSANQALIAASLAGALLRAGSPLGQTLYPSLWSAAISAVAGVTNFAVTAPVAPVVVPLGSLPTVGALTFGS